MYEGQLTSSTSANQQNVSVTPSTEAQLISKLASQRLGINTMKLPMFELLQARTHLKPGNKLWHVSYVIKPKDGVLLHPVGWSRSTSPDRLQPVASSYYAVSVSGVCRQGDASLEPWKLLVSMWYSDRSTGMNCGYRRDSASLLYLSRNLSLWIPSEHTISSF